MAQVAEPGASCIGVDPSGADNPKYCYGWLKAFKTATLALDCTDFEGKATNCWDVIDAIQIHAYARTAAEVGWTGLEYACAWNVLGGLCCLR